MNMIKSLVLGAACLFLVMGTAACSAFSSSDPAAPVAEKAQDRQPAAAAPAKASNTEKAARESLDAAGKKLVSMAARNVTPKKSNMHIRKAGKEYIGSYVEIDPSKVSTTMQKTSRGKYVGFVHYSEQHYTCRGKSKAEVQQGKDCSFSYNHMKEMMMYDGGKWHF